MTSPLYFCNWESVPSSQPGGVLEAQASRGRERVPGPAGCSELFLPATAALSPGQVRAAALRGLRNAEQQVAWRRRREVKVASNWPWIYRLAASPRQATRHRNPGVGIHGDGGSSSRNLVQTRGGRKGSSAVTAAAWKAAKKGSLPVQHEAGWPESRLCPPLGAPTTRPVLGTAQKSRVNPKPQLSGGMNKNMVPPGN